jgi:hypothetical protein
MDLAHARREARAERDWARADLLKAAIEGAGWTIVDRGVDFELRRTIPPDVIRDGVVRYGASVSVPSRLREAATLRASIVLAGLTGLTGAAEQATATIALDPTLQMIAVVDGDDRGDVDGVDVVRTATRFSPGATRNAGLRRTRGEIVVVVDTNPPFVRPEAEIAASPIADSAALLRWLSDGGLAAVEAALADPAVAVVGLAGYRSDDLRRFVLDGGGKPIAVGGPLVASRRSDLSARGPIDERLLTTGAVDIAWSLTLRDEGAAKPPRRAVALDPGSDPAVLAGDPDARLPRRDAYRLAELFADRRHLLVGGVPD